MASSVVMTPRLVRTLLILSLQKYFSRHTEYPFNRDRAKTKIFIMDDMPEDTRMHDIVPAIIVEGEGVTFQDDAIGANVRDINVDKLYYASRQSQFLAAGMVNLHCIGQSSVDAEELAFEVSMYLQSVRWNLQRMFGMQQLSIRGYGKPQVISREGTTHTYACIITVTFQLAKAVKVTPIDKGELLTEIDTYVVPNGGLPPGTVVIDAATNRYGYQIYAGIKVINNGNAGPNPEQPDIPGNPDTVDDGWVELRITVKEDDVVVEEG
jgi:hypothetical protein